MDSALGRHLIAELQGCEPELLNDVPKVEGFMVSAARKSGATVIQSSFHHFAPFGVSGTVVIQESHLAVHTWPEYGFAAIDLFTCGESVDPWIALDHLKLTFQADNCNAFELSRGQKQQLKPTNYQLGNKSLDELAPVHRFTKDLWFTERASMMALSLKHHGQSVYSEESSYQKIDIYQTEAFGKMLVLDGSIAATEQDERAYHEMLVHIPMISHQGPEDVLILGGGDGAATRELLKHPNVSTIKVVEMDAKVVEASKRFLSEAAAALLSPKVEILIKTAEAFVNTAETQFDMVLLDLVLSGLSGDRLLDAAFFKKLKRILRSNGVLIVPTGSPFLNAEIFTTNYQVLNQVFGEKHVWCYQAHVPSALTGIQTFAYCSMNSGKAPWETVNAEAQNHLLKAEALQYYHSPMHYTAFVLPKNIDRLLRNQSSI